MGRYQKTPDGEVDAVSEEGRGWADLKGGRAWHEGRPR